VKFSSISKELGKEKSPPVKTARFKSLSGKTTGSVRETSWKANLSRPKKSNSPKDKLREAFPIKTDQTQ
jgi:hypothetical protein